MAPMLRLSRTTCSTLAYDPASLETGVIHLGVGAFHRAHVADYADQAIAASVTCAGASSVPACARAIPAMR